MREFLVVKRVSGPELFVDCGWNEWNSGSCVSISGWSRVIGKRAGWW